MNPPKDEVIRYGVALIKYEFYHWRIPPVELPAESIIEKCVEKIYEKIVNNPS